MRTGGSQPETAHTSSIELTRFYEGATEYNMLAPAGWELAFGTIFFVIIKADN
jgi:hypothetical protein